MNQQRETKLIRELLETARSNTERLKDIQVTSGNLKKVAKAGSKATQREIEAEVSRLDRVAEELWSEIQLTSKRIGEIMGEPDG